MAGWFGIFSESKDIFYRYQGEKQSGKLTGKKPLGRSGF
jgi:hypothetical protein